MLEKDCHGGIRHGEPKPVKLLSIGCRNAFACGDGASGAGPVHAAPGGIEL